MATFFLRFTENAEVDLKRNCSYHSTGIRKEDSTKKEVAQMLDCSTKEVTVLDGYYVQELKGLCAFEVEADDIEEVIEKVEDYQTYHSFARGMNYAIFKGVYVDDCPEGCLFLASKIVHKGESIIA